MPLGSFSLRSVFPESNTNWTPNRNCTSEEWGKVSNCALRFRVSWLSDAPPNKLRTWGVEFYDDPTDLTVGLHFGENSTPTDVWLIVAYWRHREIKCGSALAQIMAHCLTAPSHYLNKSWFIINGVRWHSRESNFERYAHKPHLWNVIGDYTLNIATASPRVPCVKDAR